MFNLKNTSLILIYIILIGCGSTMAKGPLYSVAPAPKIDRNLSTLYVYRTDSAGGISKRLIFLDEKLLFDLKVRGYTWIQLSPGLHKIRVNKATENELSIEMKAGETYYVRSHSGSTNKSSSIGVVMIGAVPTFYPEQNGTPFQELLIEEKAVAIERLDSFGYSYQQPNFGSVPE